MAILFRPQYNNLSSTGAVYIHSNSVTIADYKDTHDSFDIFIAIGDSYEPFYQMVPLNGRPSIAKSHGTSSV